VRYLVDTNIVSEIRKSGRANAMVSRWWSSVETSKVYLSVFTIGELYRGILKLKSKDPNQAKFLGNWLRGLCSLFENRILELDLPSAMIWAEIQKDRTFPHVDSLLAATAIRHDMILVTRNTRDIEDTGVRYHNPFEVT
jgi:predicted nucleic acid-binding protein